MRKIRFLRFISISLIAICSLIFASYCVCFAKSVINYNQNTKIWEEYAHTGVINDQWDFSKLKFGFGDIGANGCGAVSVYNILTLDGKTANMPEIIQKFDLFGENVFGIGGSRPSRVIKVLKEYGFNVTYSLDKNKFENIAENSKYAIYVYFGLENFVPFGHYQLLYNFNGETFSTLNISGNYTYDEITDIPHTFFTMMIGIETK